MFSWFSFLSYAVIMSITPGANNILSMINAKNFGFKKSLPFNFGVFIGFSIVMLICTIFCNLLSIYIPTVQFYMQIIGAIYLIYLAFKIIKSTLNDNVKPTNSFIQGALLQFINPKIYVYCIVSMQTFIMPFYQNDLFMLIFFAFLLAFIGTIFTFLWAGFGSIFSIFFVKYAKITNIILALMLVYCALSLFF